MSRSRNRISESSTAGHPGLLIVGVALSTIRSTRALNEDLSDRLQARGWHVIPGSAIENPLLRALHFLWQIWVRRSEYDVAYVDVYSGRAFRWAEASSWLLRRLRKPYVLALRGGGLPNMAVRKPERVTRLLNSASVVTTPSPFLRDTMRPYREDLVLLPNPIALERYPFRFRDEVRPRLVWLRAFHPNYDPVLAVKVLARMAADIPDVSLTMVGPWSDQSVLSAVRATAQRLGVVERLKLVGGIPKADVPRLLEGCDIFLNTSVVDNTPVTVLESMACGLCVVSTDVGGIRYMVDDGVTALLVPPEDPEAMERAVRRLLNDNNLASRLSRNGRNVVETLDWSDLLPRWEALFASLAENRLESHGVTFLESEG